MLFQVDLPIGGLDIQVKKRCMCDKEIVGAVPSGIDILMVI